LEYWYRVTSLLVAVTIMAIISIEAQVIGYSLLLWEAWLFIQSLSLGLFILSRFMFKERRSS
jgi:hypothetical protein